MKDIVIIGAGVVGSAIAREISKYNGDFLVLEKHNDLCSETSKANSGIIHGGYDAKENSLMAKYNVIGNKMMDEISSDLDIPFKRIGSLVLGFSDEDLKRLEVLKKRGEYNGVSGLKIISRDEIIEIEKNVNRDVKYALLCESAGIIDPFLLNIALGENAHDNGVEFKFNCEVKNIIKREDYFEIITEKETIKSRIVVNAAGVNADYLNNLVSDKKINIIPRRGNYILLDKSLKDCVNHTIFMLPTEKGKGVLATPTIDGNLLIGPTSKDISDKTDTNTTREELNELLENIHKTIRDLPMDKIITSFSGLRAHEENHEFILNEPIDGFYNAAGIESPGLTASVAIGRHIADKISEKYHLSKNKNFKSKRVAIPRISELSFEDINKLIKKDKRYGNIICRCEKVSEGEIIDAINRSLGATSIDGIKRRVRATAGRCQGGFCLPKIMEILKGEMKVDIKNIIKEDKNSNIVVERR